MANDTHLFACPPCAAAWAATGGKKEQEGPLGQKFDFTTQDNYLHAGTWEAAESEFLQKALTLCLQKAGLHADDVGCVLGGDLQSQTTATNYALRAMGTPFFGLYGACSTMSEALALGGMLLQLPTMQRVAACACSHFAAAERQFRTPLEYGGKRTPTAQWTVTGAGAVLLAHGETPPYVRGAAIGRVVDYGVTDINNMGAAMAPAAAHTLLQFFKDTGTKPGDFDAVYTGDLGIVGTRLLHLLMAEAGTPLENHRDCGLLVYSRETQQVHAGGSGAGCSATVLATHILPRLAGGEAHDVLFTATGALMSQITFQQGESIPGIAHTVWLSHEKSGSPHPAAKEANA